MSPGLTLLLGFLLRSDFFPERVVVHESVEVEGAVQMVGFVFEGLSEQVACCANAKLLAVDVEGADADLLRAHDCASVAGYAQAAFALDFSFAFLAHDLWVDEDGGFVVVWQLDDRHAHGDAYLVGGQSDAALGVHGFDHVIYELADAPVDVLYLLRLASKHGVWHLDERQDRQRGYSPRAGLRVYEPVQDARATICPSILDSASGPPKLSWSPSVSTSKAYKVM